MKKIILLFLFLTLKVFSCASYHTPTYLNDGYYNFLDSSLVSVDTDNPMYKYAHIPPWAYQERVEYYQKIKKELNLQEWSRELKVSKKEVELVLYKDKNNTIKSEDFKIYLESLNSFSLAVDSYSDDRDLLVEKEINKLKALFKNTNSEFYRIRYAYNIARGYHYIGKFSEELSFIKEIKPLKKTKSILWEWIDSLKAGALQNKGDFVNSAYMFAKIFQTHKSDAYIGYYDFKISSDEDWKKLLTYAKSDEEKIIFHFLRAINPDNSLLVEIELMQEIDSTSIWIDRLIYLAAQKAQYKFYNKSKDSKIYLEKFVNLLEKRAEKSEFDKYVLEYMSLLRFQKSPNLENKKYLGLLKYIEYIQNLKTIDEDEISDKLLTLKKNIKDKEIQKNIKLLTLHKLANIYPKDSVKHILCSVVSSGGYWDYFDARVNLTINSLDEYNAFGAKKSKNQLELMMLETDFSLSRDELNLYYGVLNTQKGEFKKALAFIKKLPIKNQRVGDYNPFNTTLSGDNRDKSIKIYSHKKFLTTLIKIKKQLKLTPSSAMDNFLLANGYFNSSTFGNFPMSAMIYRPTTSIDKSSISSERLKLKNAKKYYHKALKNAKKREFRAKILYQLLKVSTSEQVLDDCKKSTYEYCDKPIFLVYKKGEILKVIDNSGDFRKYYDELKTYKDTKYFKNKISQCATFKYYK